MTNYPRIILGVSSTQIFKNDSNNMVLYNNNSNVLTIGNNGNVGIGTDNPSEKLEINGNTIISGNLIVNGDTLSVNTSTINVEDSMIKLSKNNISDSLDSGFYSQYVDNGITKYSGLYRDSTDGNYRLFTNLEEEPINNININTTSFSYSNLVLNNSYVNGNLNVSGIAYLNQLNITDTIITTNLQSTNTTELNDLIINGDIGIGITNPSYQLELSSDSAAKPVSSSWTISSDERIKENIEDANLDICYNDIKNIKLRRFKWSDKYIQKYNVKDKTNLGFIAQEIEKINKSAVNTCENKDFGIKDFKTINKDQLMMSLFGTVQKIQYLHENELIKTENVLHESIYEKIDSSENIKIIEMLDDMNFIKFLDKHNNKKELSEEEEKYYYGISDETIKKYFNVLSYGENTYLPTINRKGKIVNNEIEIYNHNLNNNDTILINFDIDNIKINREIKVLNVIDTTHIIIDDTDIKKYKKEINNKKIHLYGKKISNFNILNMKFLYSLCSFSLVSLKEINKKIENNLNLNLNKLNESKLKIELNNTNIQKISNSFNKLVEQIENQNKVINNLIKENNELKQKNTIYEKEIQLNKNNINLLNKQLNNQTIVLKQILEKINK